MELTKEALTGVVENLGRVKKVKVIVTETVNVGKVFDVVEITAEVTFLQKNQQHFGEDDMTVVSVVTPLSYRILSKK
jgi:hypothetical protein